MITLEDKMIPVPFHDADVVCEGFSLIMNDDIFIERSPWWSVTRWIRSVSSFVRRCSPCEVLMSSNWLGLACVPEVGPYCQLSHDVLFFYTSFYYKPGYTIYIIKLHYKINKTFIDILYSVNIVLHDIHYKACRYTRYRYTDVERLRNTVSMYGMRYTAS